jgi:hypothetical protein
VVAVSTRTRHHSPDRKGTTMRSTTRVIMAIAVLSLLALPGASAQEASASYHPPFAEGTVGGDQWTQSYSDADSGRLFMGRGNPIPGVTNCTAGLAHIHWVVEHEVSTPISEVTAAISDVAIDGYTWVTLTVKDADGEWLAYQADRGPIVLSGEVTATLFDDLPEELSPEAGDVLTIEFGLQLASACANVNGGTARFTEITVS